MRGVIFGRKGGAVMHHPMPSGIKAAGGSGEVRGCFKAPGPRHNAGAGAYVCNAWPLLGASSIYPGEQSLAS